MRLGQLTEGLCPNDGKNIAPAFDRRSDANNAPKAACAGDRGFETGQNTGAILENSRLNDSSKAARRGWFLADESSQLAAIWGISVEGSI